MFGGRIGPVEILIVAAVGLTFLALYMFAWAKVFEKSGYPPLLCLLMLIPVVQTIAFLWFAFSKWPIHKNAPGAPQSGA